MWGISPSHPFLAPHDVWQVSVNGGAVLANGDSTPSLVIRSYGKGNFIYFSQMQPVIGHGGFAPTHYSYLIFRRAIEWAFESANLPLVKVSPWGRRRLAYPINGHREGSYYIILFDGPSTTVAEVERWLAPNLGYDA